MPSIRLTQVAIDKIKPPSTGRAIYWDRLLPGFGLMVTTNGAKSWKAMYRVNRKAVMETIGSLATIPKVDDARDLARQSMVKARTGTNPVAERKQREQQNARNNPGQEDTEKNSVNHIVTRYLSKHVDANYKPRTAKETRRSFAKDVLSRWGKRDISAITRADVRRVLDDLQDRGPSAANHLLAMLKTFFAWTVNEEFIGRDQNPTTDLKPPSKDVERDRILTDDEIVSFVTGCDKIGWPYGALFKLLLLTGQRRNEVGGMEWSEIDIRERIWTIPAKRSKNGKLHIVHLSEPACEILATVPRINGSEFVFTNTGSTPVNSWSAAKAALDKHVPVQEPFTLHDLRRTAASGMAKIGIAPQVLERVLNHTSGTIKGVARIYNRYEYANERKSALEAWARHVETLIRPVPQNVVAIAQAR
jgi:integrase